MRHFLGYAHIGHFLKFREDICEPIGFGDDEGICRRTVCFMFVRGGRPSEFQKPIGEARPKAFPIHQVKGVFCRSATKICIVVGAADVPSPQGQCCACRSNSYGKSGGIQLLIRQQHGMVDTATTTINAIAAHAAIIVVVTIDMIVAATVAATTATNASTVAIPNAIAAAAATVATVAAATATATRCDYQHYDCHRGCYGE